MNVKPTQSGGRIAQGKTGFCDYFMECDADGVINLETLVMIVKTPEIAKPVDYAKPRGFGDTLNKWFSGAGFKKKCGGCAKRQHWLNEVFPYKDNEL